MSSNPESCSNSKIFHIEELMYCSQTENVSILHWKVRGQAVLQNLKLARIRSRKTFSSRVIPANKEPCSYRILVPGWSWPPCCPPAFFFSHRSETRYHCPPQYFNCYFTWGGPVCFFILNNSLCHHKYKWCQSFTLCNIYCVLLCKTSVWIDEESFLILFCFFYLWYNFQILTEMPHHNITHSRV